MTRDDNWVKYGCQIDRSPGDNGILIQTALEAGKILGAVSAQRRPIDHWLRVAYYADPPQNDVASLVYFLFIDLFFDAARDTPDYRKDHRQLCSLAAIDYIGRVRNGSTLAVDVIAAGMGIPPAKWAKKWARKFRLCQERLQAYDAEGVGMVSVEVKKLREGANNAC